MKPDHAETGGLLKKVAQSASWWRRFFASTEAEEVHDVVAELSPLDLATLDQRVRDSWSEYTYYSLNNWKDLRPSDVGRLAQSKYATSLLGLASSHFNGYIREAAVRELAKQRTGKELSFLLIRLNDWVVQVRAVAELAVRERVVPEHAVHFLANISLVLQLRVCGRLEKQVIDDVCSLLKRPECKDALQAGMASSDKAVRRISFQLAAESDPSTRSGIVRSLMTDPDAVTRAWAVRHFLPEVTPDELPGVIEPIINDKFMPVRREALCAMATKRPDLAAAPLERALLDPHASMREVARHFLKVAGVADARTYYIKALERSEKTHLYAALCGLGETGNPADASLAIEHLNSSSPKVRKAAVFAVGKLDAEGNLARLVNLLLDLRISVSREAKKALLPKVNLILLDDLEQIVASATFPHVRRNAMSLILRESKWQKLPVLLKASADENAKLVEMAIRALRVWYSSYNRSYVEPTRADLEKFQTSFEKVESKLPADIAKELRGCLKFHLK